MSAPLIGMPFPPFLTLVIISGVAAAIVHGGFRYRLFDGWEGFVGQWMVAWVGAWLGPSVLGHWFDSVMVSNIYVIPALIGGLAGALGGTLNAKVIAGSAGQRSASS
jgi:hypothetical protein